ncbi:MAG: aminotransferase [Alphaproteobacteria bacterium]|nr:aminotransferase [Alphaproteobacteria bacterium]
MHPLYAAMPISFFERMSMRARETGAINLGQGFPDGAGPPAVLQAAADALLTRSNQYPPMMGLPELRQAVASHYAREQDLNLTADDVVVTSGATEAIAAAILALVEEGDEVLMFPPLYDAYGPLVRRAGGVPRYVRLEPPEWRITPEALEAAASPKLKLVIFNDPLNPSATVASAQDRAALARFCVERDLIAICDEVWEHVVFDGTRHRSLMAEPGMAERTVKIGSAGKIFALTGWKVGWMCAAPALARVLARAHQFLTFTTPPNLQWAVAQGLAHETAWIEESRAGFERSRDRLAAGLARIGLATQPSAATWFLSLDLAASGIASSDEAFCDWMVEQAGVAAIPVSAFYPENPVTHLVRFCFAKQDSTLDEALARLERALGTVAR